MSCFKTSELHAVNYCPI